MKVRKCSQCGANMSSTETKCQYCSSSFFEEKEETTQKHREYKPFEDAFVEFAASTAASVSNAAKRVRNTISGEHINLRNSEVDRPEVFNGNILFALWLFLGIFGAHRFYVGKTVSGIIYIFTGGLFGFGILVDGLNICLGNFTDSKGNKIQPNKLLKFVAILILVIGILYFLGIVGAFIPFFFEELSLLDSISRFFA